MRIPRRTLLASVALSVCLLISGPLLASELPVVTGEHWITATERERLAFLLGLATAIEIEQEFQAADPPEPGASIVPPLVNGLDSYTLESLKAALDDWYATHPEGMQRVVVEVIWTEIALPNLPN